MPSTLYLVPVPRNKYPSPRWSLLALQTLAPLPSLAVAPVTPYQYLFIAPVTRRGKDTLYA